MGIKPLYYHLSRGTLLFASELKALMKFKAFERNLDNGAIPLFLLYQYVPAPRTIFQDTFIKVINTMKAGSYKEEGKFIQWVMRIAHNLIIDYFRKSKRIPVIDNDSTDFDIFDTISLTDKSIEERLIVNQIHKDVRGLIEHLPPEQKEVLYMRHYSEMSFKDIAEQTDVSINTALGRMRYALINLRKLIKDKNIILTT